MSKRVTKKIGHLIEYGALLVMIRIIWLLPLETMLRFADALGTFAFSVIKIRRSTVMDNLRSSFPEKSETEIEGIAKRSYQNFAKTTFEFIAMFKLDDDTLFSRCEFVNQHCLEDVFKLGKGGVLVSGHFGNWELLGAAIARLGYPMYAVVANQHNAYADRLMTQYRAKMGTTVIHVGVAVRGVIKALRNNGFIALLADQNARHDGVFVNFLGRPASTPKGPAVFSLKTGAPMVFGTAVRLPGGKHRFDIELIPHDHLTGGAIDENIQALTQIFTSKLEAKIREYPDHWFWMHRRWKTKPSESVK